MPSANALPAFSIPEAPDNDPSSSWIVVDEAMVRLHETAAAVASGNISVLIHQNATHFIDTKRQMPMMSLLRADPGLTAAPGPHEGAAAVRGAGQVEQVRAFGVVELQGAGDRVEHAG